jgi:hypothetical protein
MRGVDGAGGRGERRCALQQSFAIVVPAEVRKLGAKALQFSE